MSFLDGLLQVSNAPNNNASPDRLQPQNPDNPQQQPQSQSFNLTGQAIASLNIERVRRNFQVIKNQLGQRLNRIYKFPASFNEAKVHVRAHMNGFKTPLSRIEDENGFIPTQMCPCCQNFVNTVNIPLSYGTYPKKVDQDEIKGLMQLEAVSRLPLLTSKLFQLQPGDALFYCFVKLIITYLIIRFFIYDAYNLLTNLSGLYCELPAQMASTTNCLAPWVDYTATPNKNTPQGQGFFFVLDILNILYTLMSVLFFIYGRVKLKQLYELLEGWDITEDDYTLLIEDIPLIPFDGNDDRVKEVPGQYKQFLVYHIENKVRSWLNNFYSYKNIDDVPSSNLLEQQFFKQVYREKKQAEEEAQLYDQIVSSVNLCYDLTQLENLQVLRQKLVNDFITSDKKDLELDLNLFDDNEDIDNYEEAAHNEGQQYVSFIPHQIQIINRQYVAVCERIAEINLAAQAEQGELPVRNLRISRFVGKAFVSLKYQHYKSYLLDRYQRDNSFLKVNGNKMPLRVSGATKPYDIKWINMKISDDYRSKQLRNSYLLVSISILVSGSILYGLTELKTQYLASSSTTSKANIFQSIYVLSLPVWTFLVNYTLAWGLGQLNVYERHKTKTEELTSLIIKNVGSKFLNTAFIYALIYYFGPKINFLNGNGLVYTIVSLVIINAGLNIALELIQPYQMYLDWTNKDTIAKGEKGQKVPLFQVQLNEMIQRQPYTYEYSYSYYLQMIYIVAFYGYLVPLITPLTILAFIGQYWTDKYNLLRKFASPVDLGYSLTDLIWKGLQLTLIFHSLGHILWANSLHHHSNMMAMVCGYICLGISTLYTIWILFFDKAMQIFVERFQTKNKIYTATYNEEVKKFSKTYKTMNPATSFTDRSVSIDEDLMARVTNYSILEAQRIEYRRKFVPQNEVALEKIWSNKQDLTAVDNIRQSIENDFSTVFCCN